MGVQLSKGKCQINEVSSQRDYFVKSRYREYSSNGTNNGKYSAEQTRVLSKRPSILQSFTDKKSPSTNITSEMTEVDLPENGIVNDSTEDDDDDDEFDDPLLIRKKLLSKEENLSYVVKLRNIREAQKLKQEEEKKEQSTSLWQYVVKREKSPFYNSCNTFSKIKYGTSNENNSSNFNLTNRQKEQMLKNILENTKNISNDKASSRSLQNNNICTTKENDYKYKTDQADNILLYESNESESEKNKYFLTSKNPLVESFKSKNEISNWNKRKETNYSAQIVYTNQPKKSVGHIQVPKETHEINNIGNIETSDKCNEKKDCNVKKKIIDILCRPNSFISLCMNNGKVEKESNNKSTCNIDEFEETFYFSKRNSTIELPKQSCLLSNVISPRSSISNLSICESSSSVTTIMPFEKIKALFQRRVTTNEKFTRSKKLIRHEYYKELEDLGRGHWKNVAWVPTGGEVNKSIWENVCKGSENNTITK